MSFPHSQLYFERFKDAIKDGPLLDLNWKCRACCRLVGEHNFSPTQGKPSLSPSFLLFDSVLYEWVKYSTLISK